MRNAIFIVVITVDKERLMKRRIKEYLSAFFIITFGIAFIFIVLNHS